jgi:tetratricopeptide (TPR) repeat protein
MLELSQITETSNLLEIQDRKNAAAEAFMWVIQNHPDQPDIAAEAYVHYAAIFFEWGMEGSLSMDDVREVCGDVIGLFPNGSDRTKALAQLMISETYLNDNRPEIAVVEAAKVSAFYPLESTPAAFSHWIRGQAFERLSNYDGAIAAYKAVMDGSYTENDNFKNRNIHRMCAYRMAHCFRMMGDYDSAHQWYEFVISSWPDSPVSRTARRVLWSMPPRR